MCFWIWGSGPTGPTHLEGNTFQFAGMQVTQVLKRNVYVSPSMAATLTPGQGLGGAMDGTYLGLGDVAQFCWEDMFAKNQVEQLASPHRTQLETWKHDTHFWLPIAKRRAETK